jgi:hypothetical protein
MPGSNCGTQSFSTEISLESDVQHLLGASQQQSVNRGGKQWSKKASAFFDRLAPQSRGFQSVHSHEPQHSDATGTSYISQRYGVIELLKCSIEAGECVGSAATCPGCKMDAMQ